jgi:hypothetical protein
VAITFHVFEANRALSGVVRTRLDAVLKEAAGHAPRCSTCPALKKPSLRSCHE